ncbi:MAG: hypothetical protein QOD30_770 [Actinomycetota bacterium]|jgi:hypothetical protein|nr:hypothetical protein [Actinomycetota bacterium]
MSDKPTFLGLLNSVSLAESAAHCYLEEWIAVTDHDGVRDTLQKVSVREGEHGKAFAKRINELGYNLKPKDDPGQAKRMEIACSDMSDLEKMEAFGLGRLDSGDKPDVFDKFFADKTIDPTTGALLGRYIAEERDSGRLLKACYEQLCAEAGRAPRSSARSEDRIAALDAKVDAVCGVVEELRDLITSRLAAEPSKNGSKSRATASR